MNASRSTATFEALESRRLLSAAGTLDPSFSLDGIATNPLRIGRGNDVHLLFAADVAVQTDGKTVVAGTLRRADFSGQSDFAVARFNFDGSIDTTFGDPRFPGVAFAHLGKRHSADFANAVAIQSDGKILVAGSAEMSRKVHFDGDDFAVARFGPNGKLDPSFDGDGMRTIHFHDDSRVNDIALQSDGKIILAGVDGNFAFTTGNNDDFAVARLNPDGKLDGTFNGGGKKTIDFDDQETVHGVAIDYSGTKPSNPNYGKIVLVGETQGHESDPAFAIARVNTDGTLDKTFRGDGTGVNRFIGIDSLAARDVVVQPDGKYVLAGYADVDPAAKTSNNQFALVRYLPNGSVDSSFGGDGTGLVTTGFGGDDLGRHILRSADGGLIVGGIVNRSKFALAVYSADGILKSSFGQGGKVATDVGAGDFLELGMAKGPGKRIVLSGGHDFTTARYFDEGANVVSVGSFDPNAAEGGSNAASIIVGRSEKLPVPTRVFFTVALPLSWPALAGGAALSWARALGEFGATLMFAGNQTGRTQTLPLTIYTALESDLQTAQSLSIILVAVAFALLGAIRAGARR